MKIIITSLVITFFIMMFLLSGCLKTQSTSVPTGQKTIIPSNTSAYPTVTSTPIYTSTAGILPSTTPTLIATSASTPAPMPSLIPEEAQQEIKKLLQNSNDCTAPCFWGIIPMKTTINEARDILSHLGLELQGPETYIKFNRDYDLYGTNYSLNNGFDMIITLTVLNDVVTDISTIIHPEKQQTGMERIWSTYSPDSMIQRYGQPSKITLFSDRGVLQPNFDMVIFFDKEDTIVEYYITDIGENTTICPLSDQFDNVRLWMGKNPYYPPGPGAPLNEATSLTMNEFVKLMTGDPKNSCFDLNINAFLPQP